MNEFLRQEMRSRGWTVSRLAEACGVADGLAQRWISDNPRYRVNPSPASCEKIAAALGVDSDYVLELAGHRKAKEQRPSSVLNPQLSALLVAIEAGWLAMDEGARELAERTTRALYSVPSVRADRRRRVTDNPEKFGRPKMDGIYHIPPVNPGKRKYKSKPSVSFDTLSAHGANYQPAY